MLSDCSHQATSRAATIRQGDFLTMGPPSIGGWGRGKLRMDGSVVSDRIISKYSDSCKKYIHEFSGSSIMCISNFGGLFDG